METVNLQYLVRSMGMLSGIPIRLFEGGEYTFSWFPAPFPRDPFEVCKDEIMSIRAHVGYYVTPLFHYYGVINFEGCQIVAGPTAQVLANEQDLKELAFRADVPAGEVQDFIRGMHSITPLPVETVLQMLCTLNHFLNHGETLGIQDVAIINDEQRSIKSTVETRRTERVYEQPKTGRQSSLNLEEALADIIRRGDTVALTRWISSAPAIRGGTIAPDQLRQLRNTFIVSATLASRAAIRGGMSEEDAFALSDGYIQRVELLNDQRRILNLQYNMILEYTEQVEKLNRIKHPTRLAAEVAAYVRHHLSEPVSTERMAEELFMSRPYLSSRFRKETGMTLTDFILSEKTEEAKRLLRYSDKSSAAIGAYLGFSSHSHFIRVFKKYAGLTPNEYRQSVARR